MIYSPGVQRWPETVDLQTVLTCKREEKKKGVTKGLKHRNFRSVLSNLAPLSHLFIFFLLFFFLRRGMIQPLIYLR